MGGLLFLGENLHVDCGVLEERLVFWWWLKSFENAFRYFVSRPEVANKLLNMKRNLVPAFGGVQWIVC